MRPTLRRFGGLILAAFLLCTLAGCVSQSDSDGMTTYTYAWWAAVAGTGGAVLAAALGWFLIGSGPDMPVLGPVSVRKTGCGLLVGGPLLGVLLVPTVFTHYVKVDDQHFEVQQGWWALPVKYNVRFDQLKEMRFETEQHIRQRLPTGSYYLVCVSQGGGCRRVELDPLVREALDDLLTRAQTRGVRLPDAWHEGDED